MPSKLESRVSKHDRRIAQHDREIAAIRKPIVQGMTIYLAMGINWTNIRYDDPFEPRLRVRPQRRERHLRSHQRTMWVAVR